MVLQPRGLHYSSTSGNLSGTHGISSVANSQALTSRKGSNVCSRMRSEIRNPYNGHFRGFLPLNNIVARTRFLDEQKCHPGQRLEGCSPAARCRCHAGLPVHGSSHVSACCSPSLASYRPDSCSSYMAERQGLFYGGAGVTWF